MKKIIIATVKSWNISNAANFKNIYRKRWSARLITRKEDLDYAVIKKINPEYIFFPHWSWVIPEDIYENFKCVVFHMTDLPFGRGGSPLQNLIIRGIARTRISAIKVIKKLDGGPVYLKRDLPLKGSAQDIYKRASRIIFFNMIPYIIKNNPAPRPQAGKAVIFKRRGHQESKIPDNIGLDGIYDYIRMLDAEGYPAAFIETQKLRFEFTKARKGRNSVEASVYMAKKR